MVMMAARHEKVDARVWDQFHSKWWPLMPWKSLTYSHQADFSIDSGTVTLPGDHPLGSVFTQVRDGVPAPIRITLNGIIWDGQIKTATKELRDGVQTWTLTLASDSKHLHRMLARPPAQSAADNAEDTITGFLGDVLTKIVSVAAARTGLPTYIIQAVEGDPVELGIRTEDTVADVLGDALAGSNSYLETRMLLPEDDIPSGTGVKLYQGDVERQWAEASRAELWPHAKQDALVTDLKPASAPALPPFSYKGSESISTKGSDYQTPTWGYCYRPFQTVATANPYFEDGQRKPEPGTRVITEDDLAENHDRWGAMGAFVTEWQAGTFALKKDHQLLGDAVKAGLVRKTDGTVFKSTDEVYAYAGDSTLMYAWRDTVAWVVATDSDMRAELKRRTPWGTPAWRIPGLLVRIFGERDRRGVVFSSASGGGLSGFSVTHEAPDGAMLLAGGTVDQMALDAIQRGVSGAAEYGTQVDYSPTEAAQALGAQVGGQFTAFNADVQPKATLANSEVAFHKAGGKVDLAKAGPFFYRERYMNLTTSSTAPISEMVQEWNKAQGSTSVALTTGGAVNAVFGDDVRHEDGTITPGWREGDRVSFVDDETRISEVITGYEVRAEAGNALEVTPKLGRTDNGVMAELANRLRGVERTATQANLSQTVRVPAVEVDKRATVIVNEVADDLRKSIDSLPSADGKSTNFYGVDDPLAGGANPNPGDTWFRDNTDGSITILVFDGAKGWVEAVPEVDFTEVNARLDQARADVDKAKRDVAAAMEDVAAVESLVAKKVDTSNFDSAMAENRRRLQSLDGDLANKISRGDVQAPDIVANAVTAGKIAAGAISAREIAAGSITGDRVAANTIMARNLTITPGNLFPDPDFQDPSWPASGVTVSDDGVLSISAVGAQRGRYLQPAGQVDSAVRVEAGAAYRITANLRFGGTAGVTYVSIYMMYLSTDGTEKAHHLGRWNRDTNTLTGNSYRWGDTSLTFAIPADVVGGVATFGFFVEREHADGNVAIKNVRLVRAADGNLIVDGAVTADKIQAKAVVAGKIAAGAVTAGTIAADAVTAREIKAGSLTSDNVTIKNGAITDAMIQNGSITAASIKDATITSAKIAQLDAGKITTGYLNAGRIAAGSITTEKLAAGSITTEKLAIVPGNLFPDPHFRDPSWEKAGQTTRSGNNNGELNIFATGNQNGTYYQPAGVPADTAITVEPGSAYRVSSTIYTTTGTNQVDVYMRYRKKDSGVGPTWLGAFRNLPNGVGTYSINVQTPGDMRDGSCTIGFYLQASQTSGMVSLWNTQLTRAADSNLIVNGAIKAEHIAADTITARQVNADEIFLKADGDKSLKAQYDDLRLGMTHMQSAVSYIADRLESKTARRRGIGAIGSNYEILGSRETQSLFSASSGHLIATGAWKGRVAIITSHVDSEVVSYFYEIDAATRSVIAPTDQKYDPVFMYEVDPVSAKTYTLRPSSNWDAPKSTWATVPGMSVTLPTGTDSYNITGRVTFTNVNRGSTYGVRVLVNGSVVSKWSSTSFGPLGPWGDPTWSSNVTVAGDARGGQKLEVQVYCSDGSASKRRVTTASSMKATAYVTG